MADSDKPDTQALILKQLKSIKIALCLVVVIMLLLSGVIVVGGVVAGIAAFSGGDHYSDENGYDTMAADAEYTEDMGMNEINDPTSNE